MYHPTACQIPQSPDFSTLNLTLTRQTVALYLLKNSFSQKKAVAFTFIAFCALLIILLVYFPRDFVTILFDVIRRTLHL